MRTYSLYLLLVLLGSAPPPHNHKGHTQITGVPQGQLNGVGTRTLIASTTRQITKYFGVVQFRSQMQILFV